MAKLVWDADGERLYEVGTRQMVLYPKNISTGAYEEGVAWNGITAVNEQPSGAEETKLFADDRKYLSLWSAEEFGATIEAYTYPDEWMACDGSAELSDGVYAGQQVHKGFGFCYRTVVGNDAAGEAYGYKLHIVYNAQASPSERSYATINDSPDAITFSWEVKTTPVNVPGLTKPTSIITVDSTKADATKLGQLEDILYGSDGTATYTEVSNPSGNPHTQGYYEKTTVGGTDVYTLTNDTTVDAQKTYYSKSVSGATSARLPLPAEIVTLFGSN